MTATLTLIRQFAAPAARVYQAWTDPAHFAQWIGPVGVACELLEMNPTPDGIFRLVMNLSSGQVIHVAGRFLQLKPHDRIDFTWGPDWTGTDADPAGSLFSTVTIHLRPTGAGTEMEFLHHLPDPDMVDAHRQGWTSAFTKLQTFVET
jgi:uncharacterized protein YndB with AHSA1/START domain